MANGLGAIRRAVADIVKLHLVTVVAGASVAIGVTWAQVEAVAAPPRPQPQREARPEGVCLASPVVRRPCGQRTEASSSSGMRRVVKAPVPLPPRMGMLASAPVLPGSWGAGPGWTGPEMPMAPGFERALGAWVAESARPVTPVAWGGSVRPVPRGSVIERERPAPVPAVAAPGQPVAGPIYVQVGAFAEAANAEGAAALLGALGFGVGERAGRVRAVAAGPFATEAEARAAEAVLREAGFAGAYVTR